MGSSGCASPTSSASTCAVFFNLVKTTSYPLRFSSSLTSGQGLRCWGEGARLEGLQLSVGWFSLSPSDGETPGLCLACPWVEKKSQFLSFMAKRCSFNRASARSSIPGKALGPVLLLVECAPCGRGPAVLRTYTCQLDRPGCLI